MIEYPSRSARRHISHIVRDILYLSQWQMNVLRQAGVNELTKAEREAYRARRRRLGQLRRNLEQCRSLPS